MSARVPPSSRMPSHVATMRSSRDMRCLLLGEWRRALRQQPIDCDLRLGRCGQKRTLVIAKQLHPMANIRSMVMDMMRRQPQMRAEDAGADLGDQFFSRDCVLAE